MVHPGGFFFWYTSAHQTAFDGHSHTFCGAGHEAKTEHIRHADANQRFRNLHHAVLHGSGWLGQTCTPAGKTAGLAGSANRWPMLHPWTRLLRVPGQAGERRLSASRRRHLRTCSLRGSEMIVDRELTDDELDRARNMRGFGIHWKVISRELGVTVDAIRRAMKLPTYTEQPQRQKLPWE